MNIEGKLTITRRRDRDDGEYINIELRDENAIITPIEIKISLEQLMRALTGMGYCPCTFTTSHLDKIGKVREQDKIVFPVYKIDKKHAAEEAKKYTPEGWEASESYSSQDSFNYLGDGNYTAQTQIVRWVNREKSL